MERDMSSATAVAAPVCSRLLGGEQKRSSRQASWGKREFEASLQQSRRDGTI